MVDIPKNKRLILFDGVCNLCNSSVQYVIKHDKENIFLFASLQETVGQQVLSQYSVDSEKIDSIILYNPDKKSIDYKSTAAIKIATKLGFPKNLLVVFYVVPPFIRNIVYDYIAKNRYKWYGKKEACIIPTPELKRKFVN